MSTDIPTSAPGTAFRTGSSDGRAVDIEETLRLATEDGAFGWPADPVSSADLGVLWKELLDTRLRVVRHYNTRTLCYAEVSMPSEAPTRLSEREVSVLEHVLRGEQLKSVADALGCSLPTVSSSFRTALCKLGIDRSEAHVPLFLAILAHAARASIRDTSPMGLRFHGTGSRRRFLFARPDAWLSGVLSSSEAEVAKLLLDGDPYASIAATRATSVRTVANQIAHTYQKLGVSGRRALMVHVIEHDAEQRMKRQPAAKGAENAA